MCVGGGGVDETVVEGCIQGEFKSAGQGSQITAFLYIVRNVVWCALDML